MGLSVTGGAESIAACTEDLLAVADLFDRAAHDAEQVIAYSGSWPVQAVITAYGWPAAPVLDGVLAHIGGPWSLPGIVVGSLRGSAAKLRFAAFAYEHTDKSIFGQIGDAFDGLGDFVGAAFFGAAVGVGTHSPSAGLQTFLTSDPQLVDGIAAPVLFTGLEQLLGAHYPDGRPIVTRLGRDLSQTYAPHDITDLVDQLAARDETAAGEISVSFVTGADGRRRAIVDIPGTKSWDPGSTDDVTSLSTNARALVGRATTYEHGVLRAMDRAGVSSTDEVMFVGHSEGGMIAVTAARDAVRTGRFNVTHVVTAGAPIARSVGELPESVRVLALENDADIVPELDAGTNPATPNVTTVGFHVDTGRIVANHELTTAYEPGAAEVDASDDSSIRAFTNSARGFLSGTDEDTEAFLITRHY